MSIYSEYPVEGGGSGSGTVTSVALAAPASILSVSGSPVTTSGTLTLSLVTQSANTIFAGPTNGAAAAPTFRALVVADIPSLPYASSTLTNTHIFVGNGSNVATDVALSGDATLANTGALTLSTVNSNVGTFGAASQVSVFTVNAKGLVTAAASTSIQIAESQVTNLVSDLAGKQATGNYITALTGDGTAAGPGSAALTLATVNSNVGSFGGATTSGTFTVNAKGLITAASSTSIQIAESQVTNLVSDLAGKQPTGNYITALTSDVTASGPGSVAATIANNVVSNAKLAQMAAHTFKGNNTGSTANALDLTATQLTAELNVFTTSLQGVVPASGGGTTNFLRADGTWAAPPGGGGSGTVTSVGMTVPSFLSVSGSPVTTSGTLAVTLSGTALPLLNGGTGQTTKAAAFDALSPMSASGDLIYGGASGTGTRLTKGADGTLLTLVSGLPAWVAANGFIAEYLTASGSNGVGSTGNRMKKFTTNSGSTASMTWVADAVNGDHINITADGTYSFYFSWDTNGTDQMGIIKNASGSTTTNPYSQTTANILAIARTVGTSGNPGNCSWTGPLSNGDSVWFNQGAGTDGTTALGLVRAAKIAAGAANQTTTMNACINGGGSAITTGIKGDIYFDFACTIQAVTLLADQTGSIVIDLWKDSYGNYPPTVADTITASAKPTISAALKSQNTTLTGWTTAVAAGDTIRFNVDSVSTITRCTIALKLLRT